MIFDLGGFTFGNAQYDEIADVLYLSVDGMPEEEEAETFGSAEGHAVRVDHSGQIIGLTIVNAGWLAERSGRITITFPSQTLTVDGEEIGAAVSKAGG